MASKFIIVLASLACVANAGLIAEPAYTSYSSPVVSKTVVQPAVAYAAPAHSSSYTKTLSYTPSKAYAVSAPAAVVSHYEPQHHYAAAAPVVSYHSQPAYYAQPHYEHGHSEQNIVRSAHGTVSQISKAVDTPTSSVRKYDTRIVNDGYKTVSYQAQPATYAVHQPATTYVQSAPVVQKTIVSQPAVHYQAQPAVTYQHAQPAVHYQHAQPLTYAQHAPVLATKVQYSPAVEVAHVSFESPLAHYGW